MLKKSVKNRLPETPRVVGRRWFCSFIFYEFSFVDDRHPFQTGLNPNSSQRSEGPPSTHHSVSLICFSGVSPAAVTTEPVAPESPHHCGGRELILDTKLGHFYQELSSIYNLKVRPRGQDCMAAGLRFTRPWGWKKRWGGGGCKLPWASSHLIHASACEDSSIRADLFSQRSSDGGRHLHSLLLPLLQHLYAAVSFLLLLRHRHFCEDL